MLDAIAGAKTGIGIGVMSAVFLAGSFSHQWKRVVGWWQGARRAPAPLTASRFVDQLLQRMAAHEDWRALPAMLLAHVVELANAECGSLLVRDPVSRQFLLREVHNANPGSFQIGDIDAFLAWLARRQCTVTRRHLVDDPACAAVKTNGLQYCVQFHAEACIPCFWGGELLAVINLGPRAGDREYGAELCRLFDHMAIPGAIALNNTLVHERLAAQEHELQQVSEIRTSFLSNISHELRTPLTSIMGLSEHMLEQRDQCAPEEIPRYLQMIHDSGKRLLQTVTALLDLARLEANRQRLDIRRVNLTKLVQEVGEHLAPGPRTEVDLRLGAPLPPVYGDAGWLRCLFQHVLGNAVKYTPQGKVWLNAERCGEMLKVVVHDTGIGIPKQQQRAVFNGFVQAEGTLTRAHEGAGVGLAISRRVVELHGGRIWLESRPGEGSRVFFTLPIKPSTLM